MKKRIMAVVSVALLLLYFFSVAPAFAKYITEKGEQSEVSSLEFFFTSDYLSGSETPEYRIYSDSVEFEIRNYIDSLRVNASEIVYTVSATGGTLSPDGETLAAQTLVAKTKDSDKIKLSYSGGETEKAIIVTARSSSPYVKELKAKFVFTKPLRYEITDSVGSYYAELYIHTGDTNKAVTLNWNKAELLIDETNDYVVGKLNPEKNAASTKDIPAHTTVKIAFFKKDIKKDYSCGVTKFDGEITMPTASEP